MGVSGPQLMLTLFLFAFQVYQVTAAPSQGLTAEDACRPYFCILEDSIGEVNKMDLEELSAINRLVEIPDEDEKRRIRMPLETQTGEGIVDIPERQVDLDKARGMRTELLFTILKELDIIAHRYYQIQSIIADQVSTKGKLSALSRLCGNTVRIFCGDGSPQYRREVGAATPCKDNPQPDAFGVRRTGRSLASIVFCKGWLDSNAVHVGLPAWTQINKEASINDFRDRFLSLCPRGAAYWRHSRQYEPELHIYMTCCWTSDHIC